ncbi:site-2 protease family protein [Thermococcus nautili]|uniref:Putative membrane-associated Zn-dependent proteases 1 n=1 Tax=Thermococcus nautili TaxID=195522 RepID=W8P2C8_9EURY|nr:site-2 protease family protein [Thermococcus nautili]AHL22936.1 putative membrane-associated Zn-dependent proteases 1 [Thermococcus nautili]CAI1492604.1 Putative membrane-associated Zn-dependent proteases 1 [Thermococcus nautili]
MVSTAVIVVVALTAFWLVLYSLFGKKEIDPETGEPVEKEEGLSVDFLVAMWRTKRLLGFIDRLSRVNRRFWKVYGDIGIALGYMGMAYVFYALFMTALKTLQTKKSPSGVQLVIPGVTIPLWYGLIGLAVVMVVHELSHGVVARAEKLPLKSVGLVLLAVIPGAFVEPDEEKLSKAPLRSRLRVYGAGSMANVVTAIITALILSYAITPLLVPNGIEVGDVIKGAPADGVLHKGDVIIAINGQSVKTMDEFIALMNKTKPGETIALTVLRDGKELNLKLTLAENPDNPGKGFIGIRPNQHVTSKVGHDGIILPLFFSLYWIYLLNIGIGLMNLFPLVPLDGGRMLDDVIKEYLPERVAKPIRYATIGIGLFLLALNVLPAILNLAK